MDISSFSGSTTAIAQLSTTMSNGKLADDVGVAVLKKSMDIQEQAAMQLVESIPDVSAGLADGVGGNINVTA
ncbi:YjfB family protein [Thiorhodococcus fuscus]|uniref:YjfB family protein n=1 Tax=Thiorhodococcus fuscus TaxID=527200 RepID=A0ABW4YD38_9GAMM